MKYSFLMVALFIAITSVVHGHGLGQTLEKSTGDFVIDIDYDSYLPEIDAQTPVRFDFNLWNKDRTMSPEFTDVWVRIAPKNNFGVVFVGDISNPEFGAPGFTYAFPTLGLYELTVRFQKDGESLHEEISFPLSVLGEEAQSDSPQYRDAILGMILGVIVAFVPAYFIRRRQ